MARKYIINDKIFDLAGLKQHFPYGLHDFMHPETSNLFDSVSYKERKFTNIDNNHGWKLHADLRRTMSLEESASQIGLKPTGWNQEKYFNFEVFDQDKFDSFVDKFVKLTGGQPTPTNANATILGRLFFDQPRDMARAVTKKYVNPLHILDVVATAGEHDIEYKTDFKYGAGRMFTFYGQSLEERDRIISTLESKVGNLLEDQNDPDYLKTITDTDTLRKNTPVSKNFTARFTTDYLNIDYADSSGKPFLGINAYSSDRTLDKLQGKVQLDLSASKAIKDKYVVTGIFDPKNIDQQKQALLNLSTDFPEMQEALHGSAGYVSPYRTINDIIEYRMPGSAGINVPGSIAVNSPASAPVITKTVDATVVSNPSSKPIASTVKVGKPIVPVTHAPNKASQPAANIASNIIPSANTPIVEAAISNPPSAPVVTKVANTVAIVPPSSTVAPVTAKIANTVAAAPAPSASAAAVNVVNNIASTGAPTKGGSLISSAMEASERVTKGGNLKMVGLGALLGLGAFGLASSRRTNQDNIDRRLEMQRRGMGY